MWITCGCMCNYISVQRLLNGFHLPGVSRSWTEAHTLGRRPWDAAKLLVCSCDLELKFRNTDWKRIYEEHRIIFVMLKELIVDTPCYSTVRWITICTISDPYVCLQFTITNQSMVCFQFGMTDDGTETQARLFLGMWQCFIGHHSLRMRGGKWSNV